MKKRVWIFITLMCLITGCAQTNSELDQLNKYAGTIDQNIYVNGYFKFVADFDETWTVQQNGQDKSIKENKYSKVVLYAQKDNGMETVNIVLGDINYNPGKKTLLQKTKNKIKNSLAQLNIKDLSMETSEKKFVNQDASCIDTTGTYEQKDGNTIQCIQRQYTIEKEEYVVVITFCSINGNSVDEMEQLFYAME